MKYPKGHRKDTKKMQENVKRKCLFVDEKNRISH